MSQRPPAPEPPDLRESGRGPDGQPVYSDRRLFMQLLAFTGPTNPSELIKPLIDSGLDCVLYADAADPEGVAVLTVTEQPSDLLDALRPALRSDAWAEMMLRPEFTMMGRTYAIGYEADLDETLLGRPLRTVMNPAWPWAVWYPLRRTGAFARLELAEQRKILGEHGTIGRAFGSADLAHDVRLAGHGLNAADTDFVIGLIGKELQPLSAVVQTMRTTRQTGEFIADMGPFFVGRVIWQSAAAT